MGFQFKKVHCLRRVSTVIVFIVMLAMHVPAKASGETLVIGTPNDLSGKMAEAVVEKAFSRCGLNIEFRYFPHRRALVMANDGRIDGDLMRMKGIREHYPNLVYVPVPVNYLKMFAFAKNEFPIRSREDLQGLRVGIERGVLLSEQITEGMNALVVDSQARMMLLLEKDRLDVAVISETSGEKAVQEAGLVGIVKPMGSSLAAKPLYLHLHKRHTALIPKLTATLKAMEESGEADGIRRECKRKFQ